MTLALAELKQQMSEVSNSGSLDPVVKALDGIASTVLSKDKDALQQNLAGVWGPSSSARSLLGGRSIN